MCIVFCNQYASNIFLSFIIVHSLLIGFAANCGLTYIMHHTIYEKIKNKNLKSEIQVNSHRKSRHGYPLLRPIGESKIQVNKLKKYTGLKYFFSFDYYAAAHFKNELSKDDKNKNEEKEKSAVIKNKTSLMKRCLFIKEANRNNLIIAFSILILTVLIFQPLFNNEIKTLFLSLRLPLIVLFGGFVFCRTISRSFEITFAFYDDIHQTKKNSALTSGERISLAVRSYFEIIINFTVVYFIFEKFEKLVNGTFLTQQPIGSGIFDFIFYSFGISSFTDVSFEGNSLYWNSFVLLQLLSSMCLVYFALAKYIGDNKDKQTETAYSVENE